MSMIEVEQRVRRIMGGVLKVPPENITHDFSQDTIENWDSLAHLNLMIALEQEFKVSFNTDEILNMVSYRAICETLEGKAGLGLV